MTDTKTATLSHSGKRRVARYQIWGVGDVWVQSMTERERQFIDCKWILPGGKVDEQRRLEVLAWYIRSTIVTDQSATSFVFDDSDIQALSNLDSKVSDSYREAINSHCTMRGEDVKKNSLDHDSGPTE